MRITRIGGPTAFIELAGWRILTDPTFDPPGRTYSFGLGTSSTKVVGPAIPLDALEPVDIVLLSHHGHADNLDDAGREGLAKAATVLTTRAGAKALRHPDIRGLAAGERVTFEANGKPSLTITATPGRHGAPLTLPIVGPVIGFSLALDGAERPALWMTGDTRLSGPVRAYATDLAPEVALVHIGAVRFGLSGPLRYTMDVEEAAELIRITKPDVVVPIHVEGWSHFSEQEDAAHRAFEAAPATVSERVRWAPLGEALDPGSAS
ncbi:MBL fold metallo-hydrolase [Microbacterium sp. SS28]|uniref:MBL fold metallo-hydrolase n=1 Tax=Microbacterium sp. SS28 TaxID=2919948 RepID=UPI001FAA674C|nr:MBL fold metallo-hydrolase [Microbacterium sp. SS28]